MYLNDEKHQIMILSLCYLQNLIKPKAASGMVAEIVVYILYRKSCDNLSSRIFHKLKQNLNLVTNFKQHYLKQCIV